MAGHAPYIMPDGRPLAHFLKQDRGGSGSKRQKGKSRGKDELWAQLQRSAASMSVQEATELRILEQVGHRRRRRWLNDKLLRDMAGAMTATDMEAQFKPVPFGVEAPPSAFMQAMSPEGGVWEHFRNVDLDKEERVLQRWAEHNHALHVASSGNASLPSPAAVALHCWAAVGRTARAALRKANVHSVLELETQIIDHFAEGEPSKGKGELLLLLPDSFGRLLVHGLAEFHGLLSASRVVQREKCVAVYERPVASSPTAAAATGGAGTATAATAGGAAAGAAQRVKHDAVTCTDVLTVLHELGSCDQHTLEAYVRTHVHGSEDMACDEGYVMV